MALPTALAGQLAITAITALDVREIDGPRLGRLIEALQQALNDHHDMLAFPPGKVPAEMTATEASQRQRDYERKLDTLARRGYDPEAPVDPYETSRDRAWRAEQEACKREIEQAQRNLDEMLDAARRQVPVLSQQQLQTAIDAANASEKALNEGVLQGDHKGVSRIDNSAHPIDTAHPTGPHIQPHEMARINEETERLNTIAGGRVPDASKERW